MTVNLCYNNYVLADESRKLRFNDAAYFATHNLIVCPKRAMSFYFRRLLGQQEPNGIALLALGRYTMGKRVKSKKVIVGYSQSTYRGYATHDVDKACRWYYRDTGNVPKVAIARPDFELTNETDIVIRSYLGAANIILLAHAITGDEVRKHKTYLPQRLQTEYSVDVVDLQSRHATPRPKPSYFHKTVETKDPCACPNCGNEINDFDRLGYWYGWPLGLYPPYWDALRKYVFERDAYVCQKCKKICGIHGLRCHHIKPKEEYGTDSARNLTTLCAACHPDEHPIFPEEITNGS